MVGGEGDLGVAGEIDQGAACFGAEALREFGGVDADEAHSLAPAVEVHEQRIAVADVEDPAPLRDAGRGDGAGPITGGGATGGSAESQ